MAFVVTKDIVTGNASIDKEHVELFAKINDFMEACSRGKGRDEVLQTVEFLQNYTKTHFSNEEMLQRLNNYPDYLKHKQFHDQYMRNMVDIVNEVQSSGATIAVLGKINMQIGSALINHIKIEDVKLAKFLKDKNV